MKRILFVCIALTILPIVVYGQSKEEFNEFRQNLLKGYSTFHKTTMDNYKLFRDSINQEYAKLLNKPWQRKELVEGKPMPEWDVKPIPPVIRDKEKEKELPLPIEQVPVVVSPTPVIEEKPQPYVPIKEEGITVESVPITFSYCGTRMSIKTPKRFSFHVHGTNEEQIANAWMELSNSVTEEMLNDCLSLREKYQLCDWAYLKMLQQVSDELCKGNHNATILLQSYLFCQSGYKMRLARSKNRLYMLFASEHTIYNWGYYHVDSEIYYPLDCTEEQLSICQASFPQERSLSLLINQQPLLEYKPSTIRQLSAQEEDFSIQVNENLIQFYNTYPTSSYNNDCMTRWAMYANTPINENIAKDLYPQLKAQIVAMDVKEALQYLLTFVQFAFVYEYDDKVWGNDRAFFAEETLYYPYADCEDRSILFSRLVRDLLGLQCALVYSPGHLYTAVCLPTHVSGDAIMIDNERFLICDPTYINADIGMIMPGIDRENTKAIVLERNN